MSLFASRRVQTISAHIAASQGLQVSETVLNDDAEFEKYCTARQEVAMRLGNRGPLRFSEDGSLHPDIAQSYWKHGFYVLEGVIAQDELQDLRDEFEKLLANAPSEPGLNTDKTGRPVEFPKSYRLVKPLTDPVGGTDAAGGRFMIKMREHCKPEGAPDFVVQNIAYYLEVMDSGLRVSGHPSLLKVAEALNGPDFTPFTENIFYKPAGLGSAVAWHQDPLSTDWSPGYDEKGEVDRGSYGFSMHVSLYNCTAENGLWIVPGSNAAEGRISVQERYADCRCGDRLPDAVPILCKAGDVYLQSRQALHGSFSNTGEQRCTLQFGFHRRSAVLNRPAVGYNGKTRLYDHAWIHERSRMIQVAIDARKQKYPDEVPYVYMPFRGQEPECRWSGDRSSIKGYWRKDIVI